MRYLNCLLLLLLAAVLQSCNKNPYLPINADIKANFDYMPGSYWVYTDALSGVTDSFAVRTRTVQNNNVLNEAVFMFITRYHLNTTDTSTNTTCVLTCNYLQTYALATNVIYPFRTGIIASGGEVLAVYDTYTAGGQTYSNVAEVARTVVTPDTYTDTFYISADAGIVELKEYRKIATVITDRDFVLQRWQVVR